MCDRCNAIDRELLAFQRLGATINDVLALALMAEAVKYLRAERAARGCALSRSPRGRGQGPRPTALLALRVTVYFRSL